PPDAAETHYAQSPAPQRVDRLSGADAPDALADVPIALGHTPGHGHQERQGVIRHLFAAIVGDVGHVDAAFTGSGQVDVVDANPVPHDHLAAGHSSDGLGGDGRFTHHHRVGVAYGFNHPG